MSIFFDTNLVESMIPDNAVVCKQSLTQEQVTVIIKEGVVPCSEQACQVLEQVASGLGVTPSPTRVLDVELSIGDNPNRQQLKGYH